MPALSAAEPPSRVRAAPRRPGVVAARFSAGNGPKIGATAKPGPPGLYDVENGDDQDCRFGWVRVGPGGPRCGRSYSPTEAGCLHAAPRTGRADGPVRRVAAPSVWQLAFVRWSLRTHCWNVSTCGACLASHRLHHHTTPFASEVKSERLTTRIYTIARH